jgi:hypothetical protein
MAKKHQLKPTTLDDLAAIINQGFTETQRYLDQRLDGMKDVLTDVVQELNATHEDVRYIRTTMNLLVRNDVAQDAAIKNAQCPRRPPAALHPRVDGQHRPRHARG